MPLNDIESTLFHGMNILTTEIQISLKMLSRKTNFFFQTNTQFALSFFSYRQVVSTINEILNEKEVEENIIASDLGPLEADQIRELQKAYQETRFLIKNNTLKSVQYHG
jgi:hypothetical protein